MYTFSIYPEGEIDDRQTIIDLFDNKRDDLLYCGFNNLFYDDAMINHLIVNPRISVKELNNFSRSLVEQNQRNPYRYKSAFISIDLLEILRKGFNVKSLKGVAINLKYPRIQDLPIKPHENVKQKDFKLLQDYNINDVKITRAILEDIYDVIEMRDFLTKHYNGQVNLLTESDSGICKKLLTVFYRKKLDERNVPREDVRRSFFKRKTEHGDILMSDILYPHIKFQTACLKYHYNNIYNQVIVKKESTELSDKYDWRYSIQFLNNTYSLGLGGIHTEDSPVIYKSDDEWVIVDYDVTSMYPSSFIYNKICPQHLDKDIFLEILNDLLKERVKYKKLYKETKDKAYDNLQAAMKIALNTFFGLTNSKTFWLFDPVATFTCTVNNQLLMLMLIESLELNFYNVISANTDGITLRVKKNKLDHVRQLCKEWEKVSGFGLEETIYEFYLRRDINNYIAITEKGDTKYKGAFTPQDEKDLLKGFEYPIVPKALVEYFLNGVPIEKTVYDCKDIYDFCFSQKCGKQFTNYLRKVERKEKLRYGKDLLKIYTKPKPEITILDEKEVQSTLRFFVSLPEEKQSDEQALCEGYNDEYWIGNSLVRIKTREAPRYEAVKDQEVKKCWWIIDLLTNEKVGDPFSTKKQSEPTLKELNSKEDAKIKVQQVAEYVAGKFVTLFNDYFSVEDFADYKIDYNYYIDLVQKEVDKLEKNNDTDVSESCIF